MTDSTFQPNYITVYPTHPAYPLLLKMRDQEAEIVQLRKERDEWKEGFDNLALKKKRKKNR